MTQIDIGDPTSDLDRARGRTHQLGGRKDIVVDLGGENRFEPGRLRFLSNRANVSRSPARARNNPKRQSLCHPTLPAKKFHELYVFTRTRRNDDPSSGRGSNISKSKASINDNAPRYRT